MLSVDAFEQASSSSFHYLKQISWICTDLAHILIIFSFSVHISGSCVQYDFNFSALFILILTVVFIDDSGCYFSGWLIRNDSPFHSMVYSIRWSISLSAPIKPTVLASHQSSTAALHGMPSNRWGSFTDAVECTGACSETSGVILSGITHHSLNPQILLCDLMIFGRRNAADTHARKLHAEDGAISAEPCC